MFETLTQIDQVRLNFNAEGKQLLNFTIAFIMFGVALELKPRDFIKLWKSPKPAFIGIISQFLLMPLLTFGLAFLLKDYITPTVGLGMVLVAACPGGNISNFMSSLAKGNIALSVSLTAFSSVASLVLTPLNFAFWGNLFLKVYSNPSGINSLPTLNIEVWNVMQTIIIILGIPLVLGVLFQLKFPKITARILVSIKRISIGTFIAIVIMIFASNYDYFIKYIYYIFFIVLVHNALSLMMGYYTGKAAGLSLQDRKTVSIETGIQNSGLALALLFNPRIFPVELNVGGMAFIAAWWGVWHIISGLTIAGIWSGFSLKSSIRTA
jgi:BASS family bile acid:Na+ symporter